MRGTTYAWAFMFIGINVVCGKTNELLEVLVGQIVFCYLLLGTLGELYFHFSIMAKDSSNVKEKRIAQSVAEIQVAVEALVGVCAFSCCMYEIVDPLVCPNHGYFEEGGHEYTWGWLAANIFVYLVVCDTWFYWWHYAFHAADMLWPMHFQHHQPREPTSFGGPTVHVIELVLEYAACHHLIQYAMPFHPATHRALGAFAFIFGAVFNHGGLQLDYNDHFAHHVTWKRGRAQYCNYGLFFPFWDVIVGTRYDASAPPASAAKPKDTYSHADAIGSRPTEGRT